MRQIPLSVLTLSGILLLGCKDEQAQAAPQPSPEPAPAAAAPSEPELKPMVPSEPAAASSVASQATSPSVASLSTAGIAASGNYVVQVGILPSRSSANRLVAKLKDQGIDAYVAEVENPGELEGTYYRIRIGYFATMADARTWAESTLKPAGYDWWADAKRNDHVGNSGYASSDEQAPPPPAIAPASPKTKAPAADEWSSPAAPAAPAAASKAAAPAADGWGTPSTPAPAAPATTTEPAAAPSTPAPAAPAAPAADDGWGTPSTPAPAAPAKAPADDEWH